MNNEVFRKVRTLSAGNAVCRAIYYSFFILVVSSFFLSCRQSKVHHEGRQPVAEVNGEFLYEEDVRRALPLDLPYEDSIRYAEDFIHNWVEEVLLYQQAERNVRSTEHIEQMVSAYRKSLIIEDYQQQLISQNLSEELTEEEMLKFYNDNKTLFVLKEPALKGLFIKVPRTAPDLADLKKWYRNNDDATLEKIEKYCFRNAVIYEYFYDRWMPLSDLEGKLKASNNLRNSLKKNENHETTDEEFCYLLHVADVVPEGSTKPFELARAEIADLLSNYRQVSLIKQVKKDLYEHAMETGRVKLRTDNTNENEE